MPPLRSINTNPSPLDFINTIAQAALKTPAKSILIICTTPAAFFKQAAAAAAASASASASACTSPPTTLQTLAASSRIDVVFAPSLLHLRAYLSTITSSPRADADERGVLAIWGLIAAHKETAEYSAQGLGRTLAAMVETGREVTIADGDENWWEAEVPVLNKIGGSGLEGRGVGLERVLGRWFRFPPASVGGVGTETGAETVMGATEAAFGLGYGEGVRDEGAEA
ncbi:hypothetical protein FN846DRAFT_24086 [Sphaerosporella brunnea]|uniref:Uncharacterized protein n=1 Tax=Sphaerosporella brunnea TaxID=1250544 RepID=A0A5J5EWB7_9PEZI|nr:hypothetical protein FN846DRAFT_24086 [Sphaerosporella brunnea]